MAVGEITTDLLLNNNKIAIGWGGNDLSYGKKLVNDIENNKEDKWKIIYAYFQEMGYGNRSAYQVWNFFDIQAGDYILIPTRGSFILAQAKTEKVIPEKLEIWYVFTKEVEIIVNDNTYTRDGLPRVLFDMAKNRQTLPYPKSSEKYPEINLFIEQCKNKVKSINIGIPLYNQAYEDFKKNCQQIIKTIVNSRSFETYLKNLFIHIYEQKGFTIDTDNSNILSKNGQGRGDTDILITMSDDIILNYTIAIQAKNYDNTTGTHAVQQLVDQKEKGYNTYIVISTGDNFSSDAKYLAKSSDNDIQLMNIVDFVEFLDNNNALKNFITNEY